MRITCTSSEMGNVFRIFRDTAGFALDLQPMISLVLDSGADVLLGDPHSGAQLVITFGPQLQGVEREFLCLAKRHLDGRKRDRK
jgi:hypothetical protein